MAGLISLTLSMTVLSGLMDDAPVAQPKSAIEMGLLVSKNLSGFFSYILLTQLSNSGRVASIDSLTHPATVSL